MTADTFITSPIVQRMLGIDVRTRTRFGETVHLGVLDWTDVVFIEKLAGTHAISVPGAAIGERSSEACLRCDWLKHWVSASRPLGEWDMLCG